VSEAEVSLNRADELRQKWGTRAGQIWRAGEHRIICGDSTNQLDIEHLFKGGRNCRMLWTDPPYGVNYAAKNAYLNRTDRGNRIQKPIENDHLSPEQICALFKAALAATIPYCEPGAAGYATVASGRSLPFFIDGFEAAGFRLKANLVWVKNQFVLGMSDYQPRHELIIYGWLENGPHYFVDDRTQDSVFEVDRPAVSSLHPTAKPIELIARMVANSSRTGDLVYDPFCGSGSTIVAAHQLGRIGYGCEIDAGYVAVTLERLELLGLKPALADE
jgi:DNA modification methylase